MSLFIFLIDWKSTLDDLQNQSTVTESTRHSWREIFDYDELNEANKDSTLWDEIHRSWKNSTDLSSKPPSE